ADRPADARCPAAVAGSSDRHGPADRVASVDRVRPVLGDRDACAADPDGLCRAVRHVDRRHLPVAGDETTLTVKQITSDAIDGTHEIEVGVDDFAATNALLNVLGFTAKSYQETKRTSF